MYYVYLLESKGLREIYIGCTSDLRRRFSEHNKGLNKSTKHSAPWQLIYYEAYPNKSLAFQREKSLKRRGQTLRRLKERIGL
jgi:predicted GIY-YIG superfamily endonuclease